MRRWILDSSWRFGLILTGVVLAAFLISETVLDRWPELVEYSRGRPLARQPTGVLRDFRIAVVHCLLIGYLPAAFLAVVRGGKRTVYALQGALDCTPEECEGLASSIRFTAGGLTVAAIAGLAIGFVSPYLVKPVPQELWNPFTWSAEVAWHRILGPLTSAGSIMLAYAIVSVSRRMSRLALELRSIDLFELRPLLPFTQLGLTSALLLIGLLSIHSLMLLTESGFGLLAILVGAGVLMGAGVAFLLPLRGVRTRIGQAKAAELDWVDLELASRRTGLRRGDETRSPGEFSDLATYRTQVEDVPEWPINTSTYFRFALYLLIPVVSWVLAAVVERIIDALIS